MVKTLSTTNTFIMSDPVQVGGGDHTIFVSGNDAGAKADATGWLREWFGWVDVIDLGDITTSRGQEMLLPLWLRLWGVLGDKKGRISVLFGSALVTGALATDAARGSDAPFEQVGAPWLDTAAVRAEMDRRRDVTRHDVVSVVADTARIPEDMVARDVTRRFNFQEQCIRAGPPQLSPFGHGMVGPLLIQYGSEHCQQQFKPIAGVVTRRLCVLRWIDCAGC